MSQSPDRPLRSIRSAPFDAPEHRRARGPDGRPLCRWCGVQVPKGRQTFCGQDCVDAFLVARAGGEARRRVEKRDRGLCQRCGLKTARIEQLLRKSDPGRRRIMWQHLVRRGFKRLQSLWEMDHIVPVVDGGGSCGLENLRTLCVPCHKNETALLAARRAAERRAGGTRDLFGGQSASRPGL